MPETKKYSAKEAAAQIGTDARTLRKFIRGGKDLPISPVGQGNRYEFTAKEIKALKKLFTATTPAKTEAPATPAKKAPAKKKGKKDLADEINEQDAIDRTTEEVDLDDDDQPVDLDEIDIEDIDLDD
jgi:hypothetical protein